MSPFASRALPAVKAALAFLGVAGLLVALRFFVLPRLGCG